MLILVHDCQRKKLFHIQISMTDLNDMTSAFQLLHLILFLDSGMEKMQLSPAFPGVLQSLL